MKIRIQAVFTAVHYRKEYTGVTMESSQIRFVNRPGKRFTAKSLTFPHFTRTIHSVYLSII